MSWMVKRLADSINPGYKRLTTYLLTYPRIIHAELLTHRKLSRNSASSRAIPIQKFIQQIRSGPAAPVRWGKNGSGMQDHGPMDNDVDIMNCEQWWEASSIHAIERAEMGLKLGLHKQIVNRVMEPFMWMTCLVSATDWEDFFAQRCHKDAQPEFQYLAHMMLKDYVDARPNPVSWWGWHIPFDPGPNGDDYITDVPHPLTLQERVQVATVRCARTSYTNFEGVWSFEKYIAKHDELLSQNPRHLSPFEHCAQAHPESCHGMSNFAKSWVQYRKLPNVELPLKVGEGFDFAAHLANYEKSLTPTP